MHPNNISVFSTFIFLLITISHHPSKCWKLSDTNLNVHPEESPDPDVFEGDIMISDEEMSSMMEGVAGAGIIGRHYRWPNQLIPYVIAAGEFKPQERRIIREAMDAISQKTCMRFKERDAEKDFVYIRDLGDCTSYVGLQRTGRQNLNLSTTMRCVQKGIVIHELVHAIGFWHEQSRTDRDYFVEVRKDNIRKSAVSNFEAYTSAQVNDFDVPYDYSSIMHYPTNAFARRPNLKTIVPIRKNVIIGQRNGLSDLDALKIIRMNCPEREEGSTRPRITSVDEKLMSDGGHECVSECRKGGEAQDWCYISKESQGGKNGVERDSCKPHEDQVFILESRAVGRIVSAHGIPCGSKCERAADSKSYLCTTLHEWKSNTVDYCSPTPGYDHEMRKCATKCEYTANPFKWCYLVQGGSGYCSKTKPAENLPVAEVGTVTGRVITAHGSNCLTKCDKTDGRNFNTCKTKTSVNNGQSWDYCSAQRGYDAYDRKCTSKCGYHSRTDYKWCRVSKTAGGYCSH